MGSSDRGHRNGRPLSDCLVRRSSTVPAGMLRTWTTRHRPFSPSAAAHRRLTRYPSLHPRVRGPPSMMRSHLAPLALPLVVGRLLAPNNVAAQNRGATPATRFTVVEATIA